MVDEVEEAIVKNSVNPLAIADIQALIEPVSEYAPVIIEGKDLPKIT